jgi:hypothetical protein
MEIYSEIKKMLLQKRAGHEVEIKKIDSIIASLGGRLKPGPKPGGRGGKRKMSRKGRLAISRAKKAWWAKKKAGK